MLSTSSRGTTSDAARYIADSENSADLIGGVELNEMDRDLQVSVHFVKLNATNQIS